MKPGAKTAMKTGASSTPTAVTPNRITARVPAARSTSSWTSARDRPSSYSANTGTKAWENEPSAKKPAEDVRDPEGDEEGVHKAARQAEKHRGRNVALRSRMRSAIRKVVDAVAAGKKDDATAAFKGAQPAIDTLVNKGLIHRNKAARHKSRLAAKLKAVAKT
jgi:small subunit ribosomal protein S20